MAWAAGDPSPLSSAWRSWALIAALVVAAAAAPSGCAPEAGPGDEALAEAIAATLADAGPRVVLPALEDLARATSALAAATSLAEAAPSDAARRDDARLAWRDAMAAWQTVEVLRVGPLADSSHDAGGQDLRARFTAWPDTNPCRVDQELVAARWDDPTFFDVTLPHVHGLAALEQLLFVDDPDSACPPQVDIHADGTWDALSAEELSAHRASFARALASRLDADAASLRDAWSPDGGDFAGALARAGDGQPYGSSQDGLQALFDALFFSMAHVVRAKLDEPLGLGACTTDCLAGVESPVAGGSLDWITLNLASVRRLLKGGDGRGLLDLAAAAGQQQARDAVVTALDAADAAAGAVDGDLPDAAVADAADLEALRVALEELKERIEDDLRVALTLHIASEAAGDND